MQDTAGHGPIKKTSIHNMTVRYGGTVFAPICTIIEGSIQQLGATEVEISSRYGVWRDGKSVADLGWDGYGGHCAGAERPKQSLAGVDTLPCRERRVSAGVPEPEAESGCSVFVGIASPPRGRAPPCPSVRLAMTCREQRLAMIQGKWG
jgi:hypothetical protein